MSQWGRTTSLAYLPPQGPLFHHLTTLTLPANCALESILPTGLRTTPGLSDKQARSKTSPKVCLWPNQIHSTNAGGYNKIEEISNDLISKGSGRYSILGFCQVGCGAKSRGSPVMQLTWGMMTSRLSTSRASMWRSQSLCEHWT